MSESMIPFSIKAKGYDPEMVDLYLQKITDEYSKLQLGYKKLSHQYDELETQVGSKMRAIAKVMVDAEAYAMKTVSDAKAEAGRIIDGAHQDLAALKNEKALLISDIKNILGKLKSSGIGN